jgi:uncharacterized protein (TIGR02996 family)
MSDEKALLDSIWEHPHADAPRLVYADWLDDRGGASDAARAELIRAHIELDRLDGDDPRFDELERRADELEQQWGKAWSKAQPPGAKKVNCYTGGLPVPYLGSFKVEGLVKLSAARLRAAPLWRFHYGVYGNHLDQLLAWPLLHRLELFALRPPLPGDWAERLAACDNLRNVTDLELIDCWPAAEELKVVLDAFTGRHLKRLRVNTEDPAALAVLAAHPACANLRDLVIEESRLAPVAVRNLAKGSALSRLLHFAFEHNRPGGDAVAREVLKLPFVPKLRWLDLSQDRLTNAGAELVAQSAALANVRSLWLSQNGIGAAGYRALVASPHLARVKSLGTYDNPGNDSESARTELRERFPEVIG